MINVLRLKGKVLRTVAGIRGLLSVLATLAVVLAVAAAGHFSRVGASEFPLDAIGRLFIGDSGMCTAFVIRSLERPGVNRVGQPESSYENWLVSAGHCVGDEMVFVQRSGRYPIVGVVGFSSGGLRGFDVLVTAFVTDRPMPILEPAFGEYPQTGDRLMLIGFGRGTLMMRVGPLLGYDDRGHLAIQSFASPGNSGGPVLIPGTRRVVGIGIETTLDIRPGAAAFLCGFGGCGVKPPYYAAHVDRLLGVASFR